jgi:hypothetical protein
MNWVQRIRNWSGRSDFEHTVKFCLFSKETQSIALNSIYAGVNAKVAYLEYVYLQAVQLAYINACAVMVTVSKNRPAGTKWCACGWPNRHTIKFQYSPVKERAKTGKTVSIQGIVNRVVDQMLTKSP